MMAILKRLALTGMASMFVFVAMASIKPYCWMLIHEPDVPECLKK